MATWPPYSDAQVDALINVLLDRGNVIDKSVFQNFTTEQANRYVAAVERRAMATAMDIRQEWERGGPDPGIVAVGPAGEGIRQAAPVFSFARPVPWPTVPDDASALDAM